jgi:hypothetical protein
MKCASPGCRHKVSASVRRRRMIARRGAHHCASLHLPGLCRRSVLEHRALQRGDPAALCRCRARTAAAAQCGPADASSARSGAAGYQLRGMAVLCRHRAAPANCSHDRPGNLRPLWGHRRKKGATPSRGGGRERLVCLTALVSPIAPVLRCIPATWTEGAC